jgi:hypothetical protein
MMWALLLAIALQPVIDVAPEDVPSVPGFVPQPPGLNIGVDVRDDELTRGLQAARLRAGHTVIGGYGQLQLQLASVGPPLLGEIIAPPTATATVRRMVLFVAHTFTPSLRLYAEFEWENAVASRSTPGSAEIEQVFVEWDLIIGEKKGDLSSWLSLRAGLLLVPIGILNQWHEPPVFHGTDRSLLEQVLLPSTWRELGFGFTGVLWPGLTYEAYLLTGLDASKFSSAGLAAGRTNGALTNASSWQAVARVEVEPVVGAIVAGTVLGGDVGGGLFGQTPYVDALGLPSNKWLPLVITELDARVRRGGLEARTLWVTTFFPGAGELATAVRKDGTPSTVVVDKKTMATRMTGAQLEIAYDVFAPFQFTEQQLLPFVRIENVDLQAAVPDGFVIDRSQQWRELTVGISYRPIRTVVLKGDVQLRNRVRGFDELWGNIGLGMMF